jgi:hypothetical protein
MTLISVVLAGDGDRFFAPSDKLVLSIWSHPREEFLDLSISLVHERHPCNCQVQHFSNILVRVLLTCDHDCLTAFAQSLEFSSTSVDGALNVIERCWKF